MRYHIVWLSLVWIFLGSFFPGVVEADSPELVELEEETIERLGEARLASVRVTGLRKTRPEVIAPIVDIRKGMALGMVDFEAVRQELRKTGLFGDITFRYRQLPGGELELEILLEERFSLVGIPVVATDGESFTVGATLFEANFLGLRRLLIAAGFYTLDKGPIFSLGYIDPALADRNGAFVFFAGGGNSDRELALADGTVIRSFSAEALRFAAALRMRTLRRLQPGVQVKYEGVFVEPGDGAVDSAQMAGLGASLGWEDLTYLRFFQKGLRVNLDVTAGYDFIATGSGNPWFGEASVDGAYSAAPFSDVLIRFEFHGGFSTAPAALLKSLPGGGGFRVLPASESAGREFLAGAVTWEMPLLRFSWGTGTVAAFFDGGVYDPDGGVSAGRVLFYGPGGGLRLYLDKVVFPALQLNGGWNIPAERFQFSFSLGMGM